MVISGFACFDDFRIALHNQCMKGLEPVSLGKVLRDTTSRGDLLAEMRDDDRKGFALFDGITVLLPPAGGGTSRSRA